MIVPPLGAPQIGGADLTAGFMSCVCVCPLVGGSVPSMDGKNTRFFYKNRFSEKYMFLVFILMISVV